MKYFVLYFLGCCLFFLSSCKKDKVETECLTNETIRFNDQIKPIIQDNCISCHGPGMTSPNLSGHANVAANATKILNSMNGTGSQLMPLGGPALNDTLISQFSCWISQGKQNN
jgi:hypothetical protein